MKSRSGPLLGRDGDRDAAERGLLLGQGVELLAGLSIRKRHRDQTRELPESRLGVRRKLLAARDRDHNRAPDDAGDDDRRGDQGGHSERGEPLVKLRCDAGVLRGHSCRRALRATSESALPAGMSTVPESGIRTPGSLHLPTMTACSRVRREAHEIRGVGAEQPGNLLGHDVEDPLRRRSVATVTATRFRAACSSTSTAQIDFLPLPLGDVADDPDDLVVAAADDARLVVVHPVRLAGLVLDGHDLVGGERAP